jgi:hypothetical protein
MFHDSIAANGPLARLPGRRTVCARLDLAPARTTVIADGISVVAGFTADEDTVAA